MPFATRARNDIDEVTRRELAKNVLHRRHVNGAILVTAHAALCTSGLAPSLHLPAP